VRERDVRETSERLALSHFGVATDYRSLLQNVVCFIWLFAKETYHFVRERIQESV